MVVQIFETMTCLRLLDNHCLGCSNGTKVCLRREIFIFEVSNAVYVRFERGFVLLGYSTGHLSKGNLCK